MSGNVKMFDAYYDARTRTAGQDRVGGASRSLSKLSTTSIQE
jgi:hypothetical protein